MSPEKVDPTRFSVLRRASGRATSVIYLEFSPARRTS